MQPQLLFEDPLSHLGLECVKTCGLGIIQAEARLFFNRGPLEVVQNLGLSSRERLSTRHMPLVVVSLVSRNDSIASPKVHSGKSCACFLLIHSAVKIMQMHFITLPKQTTGEY